MEVLPSFGRLLKRRFSREGQRFRTERRDGQMVIPPVACEISGPFMGGIAANSWSAE